MTSPSVLTAAGVVVLAATMLACRGETSSMRVVTQQVRAGDVVVVRFDAPPVAEFARGDVWLTLAPAGTGDDYPGDRVVIEEGAAEAAIATVAQGSYELRLVDRSPRRLSRVVARLDLVVQRAALAQREAPAWYW
jgi:hypothetical protein